MFTIRYVTVISYVLFPVKSLHIFTHLTDILINGNTTRNLGEHGVRASQEHLAGVQFIDRVGLEGILVTVSSGSVAVRVWAAQVADGANGDVQLGTSPEFEFVLRFVDGTGPFNGHLDDGISTGRGCLDVTEVVENTCNFIQVEMLPVM